MTDAAKTERLERLLDAIDLIRGDQRADARALLRDLIRDDSDFESAWLWMSVAVDSLDQSAVCLDNVLRINPRNGEAASALYRIRLTEMQVKRRRDRLSFWRNMALTILWLAILTALGGAMITLTQIGAQMAG